MFGDGKQSRCFCYVGDVVKALAKLVREKSAAGEVFNLGSPEEVTIEELAHRVRRIAKSRSEIVYVPYEKAYEEGFEDMPRRIPSIEKIQRQIQFCPETPLDQIIELVVTHERAQRALAAQCGN